MCERICMLRNTCRHRNLIMCFVLIFTPGSWLIYTLSNGSCTFWLLVRFGCWVTPVENPVIHSPWYLLDRLHRMALLTEAIKAPIPSMLAAGCQSGKVNRVTSLLDALRLLVLTVKGRSLSLSRWTSLYDSSFRFQWLLLPPCPYGLRGVLTPCNQLSIFALLLVILLHPHFCK